VKHFKVPVPENWGAIQKPREPRVAQSSERQTGQVVCYSTIHGFGWIRPDDGGKDVHVGVLAVEQSGLSDLRPGDEVSFIIGGGRRPTARNIKILAENS
jgi:cold shock protein